MERNFRSSCGKSLKVICRSGNNLFSSCRSSSFVLSGCDVGREGHYAGNCQKHEKLFHNEFNNVLVVILFYFLKSVQFSKKNSYGKNYFDISPFRFISKRVLTLELSL